MTHPDFISVEASKSARIEANRADFFLTISGSSLFSGAVALQKTREVAELVTALREVGIEENQIHVEGIRAEIHSGTFSKSSTAHYSLRIEDVLPELVTEVIGSISEAKNASLKYIQWRFSNEDLLRDELRQECLRVALERAKSIAATLNVRLLGIFEMEEKWRGTEPDLPEQDMLFQLIDDSAKKKRAVPEFGMAVSHAETVSLQVTFKFRVSEFESA